MITQAIIFCCLLFTPNAYAGAMEIDFPGGRIALSHDGNNYDKNDYQPGTKTSELQFNNLKAGETYTLVVSGRSQKFKLDRIVFRHDSIAPKVAQQIQVPESTRIKSRPAAKK